ncbi:DegV family protein [Streptosporangiaceae bacterium NEAU-GS5]|nr:DegV family protein [Streptosporangiaceae bacterium NEAU-GS5]
MSPPVAVVTDSTAYLMAADIERWGISVVPLHVMIGGRQFDDGDQVDAGDIAQALRARAPVTTSRPAPQRFTEEYEKAAVAGATGVISVHLSSQISGTVEAATIAAKEAPIPVEVIDSRSIAMGLGFPALAAARAAEQGADLAEAAAMARQCAAATRSYFYVDTLEHLRRGGRIGVIANLFGSALAIKPLLHIGDGAISLLEKVRTSSRAIARLEELALLAAGDDAVNVAVCHLSAAPRAEALAARLADRIPNAVRLLTVEVGPVVSAHTGPGLLGVTISPTF